MTANNLVGQCTEVDTSDPNQAGKVIQTSPAPTPRPTRARR